MPPKRSAKTSNSETEAVDSKKARKKLPQNAPHAVVVRQRGKNLLLDPEQYRPKTVGKRVLTCGDGGFGQIGHGEDRTESLKPRLVQTLEGKNIIDVAAGGIHSIVLEENGKVWTCGPNDHGTVPVTEAGESVYEFTQIESIDSFTNEHGKPVSIVAGASFGAALTEKGSVIGWGEIRNDSGQLTNHPLFTKMSNSPTVIIPYTEYRVVKIAAGDNHLAILSVDRQLLVLGDGQHGQLGRISSRGSEVIRGGRAMDLKRMRVKGTSGRSFIDHFKNIWTISFSTLALGNDNRIYVFGLNNYEQLGIAHQPENAQSENQPNLEIQYPTVSEIFDIPDDESWTDFHGNHHLIALKSSGELFGVGKTDDGRLGQEGLQWKMNNLTKIPLENSVIGCSACLSGSVAWNEQGDAWSWGCDTVGQLGLGEGDNEIVNEPRKILSKHLDGHQIIKVSMSDQHSIFLAS